MGGCYDRSASQRINALVVVRGRPSLGLLALPVHSTGRCISARSEHLAMDQRSTLLRCTEVYFAPARAFGGIGAQRGTVERGTSGDVPVRALRRPPLALEPPSGWLARGRGRPRSDGAIPCLARWVDARRGRDRLCGAAAWCMCGAVLADRQGSADPRQAGQADRGERRATARGCKGRDGANGRRRPGARKQGAPNPCEHVRR